MGLFRFTSRVSQALRYLEDHYRCQRLGMNGRQYLAREFSFDAVLARYLGELG